MLVLDLSLQAYDDKLNSFLTTLKEEKGIEKKEETKGKYGYNSKGKERG